MKRNKEEDIKPIGEAIRGLLNAYNLSSKFDEASLLNSWEELVGKPIAKRTKKLFIKNKVLFIEFTSPTMRHDFALHKNQVLDILKNKFGPGMITEIIVM